MFQVIPTWEVRWRMSVGSHEHELFLRVPDTELDAVLKALRFSGAIETFSAHREARDGR
jgi:hypothetical protein